ncbi:MAG: hypothetical protein JWN10_1098 [Solirubrobacterales bacterium]|nr:hypothetical protein [Solirubrobacterales bacterium]
MSSESLLGRSRATTLLVCAVLAGVGVALTPARTAGAQAQSARSPRTSVPTHEDVATTSAKASCGPAAPETLAQTVGWVAKQIYYGEVSSSRTVADRHQVESYAPLLRAVAGDQQAATKAAVTKLVYSHTHIVRLRVIRGSKLLADVGGPYVLAPLGGTLRLHGRVVGHYLLSVQDDLGYVKIETHFIGAPLVLRIGARTVPVEGLLAPGPAVIPEHGPIAYRHVIYQAYSFDASAFPSGPLRISVLVPLPAGLAQKSCTIIKNSELAVVARRVFGRLALSHVSFSTGVELVRTLTRGLFYVRAGSHQLAGSTGPGPARLPLSGSVRYHGASYQVFSFQAPGNVAKIRIYELFAG